MASQRTSWIAGGLAFCLAAGTLLASEYRGTIRAGGLPLPGATVTATRGDQKLAATTDERGLFRFADLSDGAWTLAVEMVGFQKMTRDVGVAADAPAPVWDLQYLLRAGAAGRLRRGAGCRGARCDAAARLSARGRESVGEFLGRRGGWRPEDRRSENRSCVASAGVIHGWAMKQSQDLHLGSRGEAPRSWPVSQRFSSRCTSHR